MGKQDSFEQPLDYSSLAPSGQRKLMLHEAWTQNKSWHRRKANCATLLWLLRGLCHMKLRKNGEALFKKHSGWKHACKVQWRNKSSTHFFQVCLKLVPPGDFASTSRGSIFSLIKYFKKPLRLLRERSSLNPRPEALIIMDLCESCQILPCSVIRAVPRVCFVSH